MEPEQIHPSKVELAEAQEKVRREQAKEQVRRFEEGEPGASLKVECQMAEAYLDRGQEYVDEITDESLTR
jgi:hypothetical protein